MADYYLKLEDLSVGYGGKPLLSDINIEIDKGEIVTLIGPNGAGKSTILKSISRQLKLLGGKVFLMEESVQDLSWRALSKKMAVVLTERMRPELMTCRDVVATGRYPYTGKFGVLSEADRRIVRESMELVHIEELADRDFMQTSDGQKQRVMLARAICHECEHLHGHLYVERVEGELMDVEEEED